MNEKEVIQLDIRLEADKRVIAGILVENGYTVRKITASVGNRKKTILEAFKEEV